MPYPYTSARQQKTVLFVISNLLTNDSHVRVRFTENNAESYRFIVSDYINPSMQIHADDSLRSIVLLFGNTRRKETYERLITEFNAGE